MKIKATQAHNSRRPVAVYTIGGLMIALVVGGLLFSLLKSLKTANVYTPLENAAVEIKFNGAMANLDLEKGESAGAVAKDLDHALQIANAMLKGGDLGGDIGRLVPLEDETLRENIAKAAKDIEELSGTLQ